MEELMLQIEEALVRGLYYLALFGALAIPDIGAALADPAGRTSGPKYQAWFNSYGPRYGPTFDGAVCYGYRCSMLHQGSAMPHSSLYDRVIFVEPGHGVSVHNSTMEMGGQRVCVMDVELLCRDIVLATRTWLAQFGQTKVVQKNLPALVTRHPNGLSPYIVGVPVVG